MTNVLLEKKGHIAVATINRPKALNALNSDVLTDLGELVDIVNADSEIRALVLTGSGEKAFVAGADIGEMSTLTPEEGEAFGKHGNDVFRRIETLPIPTIAAINGFALGGGCELSMSCDIRICADTAVFGQPETGCEDILALLRSYHTQRRSTVVLVSHSMEEIARNAQRIIVLDKGGVCMQGSPAEVFARARELESIGLDVPQVTKIAHALHEKGVAIDPAVYTVEALRAQLLALKGGRSLC